MALELAMNSLSLVAGRTLLSQSGEDRESLLLPMYHRFLSDRDTSAFILDVSSRYTSATLARLAEYGPREARRAATHALGLVGDFSSNDVLGRRMSDRDRGVRLLAERLIRDVWFRDGSSDQRHELLRLQRLNDEGRAYECVQKATILLADSPWLAEAWHQRAVARAIQQDHHRSKDDCFQALELNPYHFLAAVNMGHCYLELKQRREALDCFRRALRVNPGLEAVRARAALLQRALEGK